MRYWWVNQNQTYEHEIRGGYLWSPKVNANGARNPFYREAAILPELRRSLAVYRMVFGQPRQDDLMNYLSRTIPEDDLIEIAQAITINLEPR